MARIISVYKTKAREEMYLYVDKKEALSKVPQPLLDMFGQPVKVMDFLLRPERQLARANAEDVLESIGEKGFFLQMPPAKDEIADGESNEEK